MIEDLRRRGRLPPDFSATCELQECSSSVDNVATVKFKAVMPGRNTVSNPASISGNIPWQYSTSFLESANLEEYSWQRRKEQICTYPADRKKMIDALKQTYSENLSIISEKLGVEIDDITQSWENLRVQETATGARWEEQRGGHDERRRGRGGGGRGGSSCEANPPPNRMYVHAQHASVLTFLAGRRRWRERPRARQPLLRTGHGGA